MKDSTRKSVQRFVLTLFPEAHCVHTSIGVAVVVDNVARRALTPHMTDEDEAWLMAAEQLGWV